jgi:hypothetical protein
MRWPMLDTDIGNVIPPSIAGRSSGSPYRRRSLPQPRRLPNVSNTINLRVGGFRGSRLAVLSGISFLQRRKLVKLLRAFTLTWVQKRSLHALCLGLRSGCPLCCDLGNPSDVGVTFLGVGEVLAMEDLETPILFDKSDDEDGTPGECVPEDGSGRDCTLRYGYVLWSTVIGKPWRERQTWMMTFPGASITS